MRVVAVLTEYAVVDRIIGHLKLAFVADRPPPPQAAFQELLWEADPPAEKEFLILKAVAPSTPGVPLPGMAGKGGFSAG